MSWSHFHFKCRYLASKLRQGHTKSQAINASEQVEISQLFGKSALTPAQQSFYSEILTIEDTNKLIDTLDAINGINFNKVNFDKSLAKKSSQTKDYAIGLYFIFAIMAYGASTFLVPQFIEMYISFNSPVPFLLGKFSEVLFTVALILLFPVGLAIYTSKSLAQLNNLLVKDSSPRLFRLFLPKTTLNKMSKLHQLARLPLRSKPKKNSAFESLIYELELSGEALGTELASILTFYIEEIDHECNKLLNRLLKLIHALLFIGIGFYITQLYEPIFAMGAIIS
ncbi:hypothetical protein D5R81_11145 [Parashewanella spongiae]|uniref:Type II secretion system protein GspF domain-containing protein n=1 Tax=Parashewanella spongiae TaxID=342950 RepID=A0A3A6TQ13_9GAMM|nr:hypothetical protein [Parashewanella spongiae]MCL1078539.1 hypothetical protein [Parashewanella spongiae]RJY13443.1 hypothetical protein D5R81_11145 [Parashewanella spongiae]